LARRVVKVASDDLHPVQYQADLLARLCLLTRRVKHQDCELTVRCTVVVFDCINRICATTRPCYVECCHNSYKLHVGADGTSRVTNYTVLWETSLHWVEMIQLVEDD